MKIAQIMGRGIEGAGVTRYVIELNNTLKSKDIKADIFVVEDKIWGRSKNQGLNDYTPIDDIEFSELLNKLNEYDYVFIHSVPSVKHSEFIQEKFLKLIKELSTKKIIFQNDHKLQSISRNANFIEMCQYVDKICAFNTTCPFYKKLITTYGEDIKNKYVHLHNIYNFDKLIEYRKENQSKKIAYLGRFATFKDPQRLINMLPYTAKNNILLELIGIERSLGALNIFYDNIEQKIPSSKIIEVNKKNLDAGLLIEDNERDINKAYIWGPYEYKTGINQLSSSMFGASFYHLSPESYGDNVEYAQCEMIGVGCIPIFDSNFGDNCYAHENGIQTNNKFKDIENFALFLNKDLSNVDEVINSVNEIYLNKNIQNKYKEVSLDVIKKHTDSNAIVDKLLNDIC